MTAEIYLTIDDSPSAATGRLVDFLNDRGIPALFFCRSDGVDRHGRGGLLHAIRSGHVLANHSAAHIPAGDLTFDQWRADFERCEAVLDSLYAEAGAVRPGKYYRFPYLDRGDGDRVERRFPALINAVAQGETPDLAQTGKMPDIQRYLKERGFTQPFAGVTHPLYRIPAIQDAADCFLTYSSGDWMLTARHLGNWPQQSAGDIIRAMEADPWLLKPGERSILLMHDDAEISDAFSSIISYVAERKVRFLRF